MRMQAPYTLTSETEQSLRFYAALLPLIWAVNTHIDPTLVARVNFSHASQGNSSLSHSIINTNFYSEYSQSSGRGSTANTFQFTIRELIAVHDIANLNLEAAFFGYRYNI